MNPIKKKAEFTHIRTSFETTDATDFGNQIATEAAHASADNRQGSVIQYDGEENRIAGKNVIEAFEGNNCVIFNETYMIVGEHSQAKKIHAIYDLTIFGNVTVQDCTVNGSLTIIGNADIGNLNCNNTLICKGNLRSEQIYVGGNIIAGSIDCDEINCDENVVLQTTANINRNAEIGKTIVACEGIMGDGTFSAVNAIANEYFEFNGEYEGKILELETDTVKSDTVPAKIIHCETVEETIDLANQKLAEEYSRFPELDEEEIIDRLKTISGIQGHDLKVMPIAEPLFTRLTEISYKDGIETVDEYLTALAAKRVLPESIYNYESIDHIGKLFLPKAEREIEKLKFMPCTVKQFSRVLSMAILFKEDISAYREMLMDKIFESVGVKYSTVISLIRKNKPE